MIIIIVVVESQEWKSIEEFFIITSVSIYSRNILLIWKERI